MPPLPKKIRRIRHRAPRVEKKHLALGRTGKRGDSMWLLGLMAAAWRLLAAAWRLLAAAWRLLAALCFQQFSFDIYLIFNLSWGGPQEIPRNPPQKPPSPHHQQSSWRLHAAPGRLGAAHGSCLAAPGSCVAAPGVSWCSKLTFPSVVLF